MKNGSELVWSMCEWLRRIECTPTWLLDREGLRQRAGVERDRAVDQQAGHPALQALAAVAS